MLRYPSLRYSGLCILAALFALQGCATSFTKGSDRRTEGAYIEDSTIGNTALARIKKEYGAKVHININSYNRKVLVTGEVPDEAAKTDVIRIIRRVQNVSDVFNELQIGPLTTFSTRSSDTITTSNVNFRLRNVIGKEFFKANRVTVVTERDIVYLMGLVTRAEADVALDVASTSNGVKKVVHFFEYID